jgi:hypothetical protein
MKKKHIPIAAAIVLLLALLTVVAFVLLRKNPNEDLPPLLTSPSASASTLLLEVDASDDASDDAEPEGGKPPKPGPDAARITRLIACCRVLGQNAASVGDPLTRGSMLQTAAVCEAAARSGNYDAVDASLRKYEVPCN